MMTIWKDVNERDYKTTRDTHFCCNLGIFLPIYHLHDSKCSPKNTPGTIPYYFKIMPKKALNDKLIKDSVDKPSKLSVTPKKSFRSFLE